MAQAQACEECTADWLLHLSTCEERLESQAASSSSSHVARGSVYIQYKNSPNAASRRSQNANRHAKSLVCARFRCFRFPAFGLLPNLCWSLQTSADQVPFSVLYVLYYIVTYCGQESNEGVASSFV